MWPHLRVQGKGAAKVRAGRGTERSGGQLERGRHCGQDGERAPGTQTGEPSLLPALPYAAARGLPLLGGPRPCGRRSLLFRGAGSQSRPSFLGVRASSPPLLSISEATRCLLSSRRLAMAEQTSPRGGPPARCPPSRAGRLRSALQRVRERHGGKHSCPHVTDEEAEAQLRRAAPSPRRRAGNQLRAVWR